MKGEIFLLLTGMFIVIILILLLIGVDQRIELEKYKIDNIDNVEDVKNFLIDCKSKAWLVDCDNLLLDELNKGEK